MQRAVPAGGKPATLMVELGLAQEADGMVTEKTDYSEAFDPKFSHYDLGQPVLIDLLRTYADYIRRMDGIWYVTVMEKWGNSKALKTDLKVWEKAKLYEMRVFSEAFNLHGDDVPTAMKYLQICPWVWPYDHKIKLRDTKYGVFTKYTCPTLSALEKEGNGREAEQCRDVCPKGLEYMAHFFNPGMKVIPLRIPPRRDYDDMCCQFAFEVKR